MHVAFNGWFWDKPNAGSGQYIRRLLHYLRRIDPALHMTLVLPPHNNEPEDLPTDVNVMTTGDGSGQTGNLGKVWFEQRTYPRMVQQCGADLAHVPYWGSPLSSPVPLITSVLDVVPLIYPIYASGLKGRLYTSLVSMSARGSQHIITLSETAKLDIERYLNIPEEKITATYLATDSIYHPKMGSEHDELVREKYNLPDHYVLYIGNFDIRKRVNELLLAYTYVAEAEGDNYPLVIVGKEPEWGTPMFPDMREYAKRLNITDYVQWTGFVDEADKPAVYRMADVFVSPSEYEGFGLPVLEAMACGTPVVAANIDVYDEILGEAAYLVNSPREMAGAIIALLLQKPMRDTMINQGLARVTQYSWRKTAQQTRKIYDYVLENTAG